MILLLVLKKDFNSMIKIKNNYKNNISLLTIFKCLIIKKSNIIIKKINFKSRRYLIEYFIKYSKKIIIFA